MPSWERGAGFRIVGAVVRVFVAQSGKFAKLTLGVPGKSGENKVDVRAFDLAVVEEIRGLGAGMTVQVTGTLDTEPVKNKAGEKVMVDGYPVWISVPTARKIEVEGSSRAPAAPSNGAPPPAEDKGW